MLFHFIFLQGETTTVVTCMHPSTMNLFRVGVPLLQRETTIVVSCMHPSTMNLFWARGAGRGGGGGGEGG